MRLGFLITSNQITINLHRHVRCTKIKVTKFKLTPDNLAANAICINIINIFSSNAIITPDNHCTSYFFMLPFINNNNVHSYSNDVVDTWDFKSVNELVLNKFIITITDENGTLLTFNNSNIVMELLFEE